MRKKIIQELNMINMQAETSGASLENSYLDLILEFFALAENIYLIAFLVLTSEFMTNSCVLFLE